MRKLILFNVLLFIVLLVFQQMNVSFYNYIHFISWQSQFTREDYAMIAFVLMLILILNVYLIFKVLNKTRVENHVKIMHYEVLGLLIIGVVITIYMIFSVFFPVQPSVITFDYNRPYVACVVVYFIELAILVYLLIKCVKIKNKINEIKMHYYWILPLSYFIFGIIVMEVEGFILGVIEESIEFRVFLNQFNMYLFIVMGVLFCLVLIRKIFSLKYSKLQTWLLIFFLLLTTAIDSIYWINNIKWL